LQTLAVDLREIIIGELAVLFFDLSSRRLAGRMVMSALTGWW
jgi:hypothetical protein